MGIKSFSKVFDGKEVKLKDFKYKVFAVDAMYQLHRTAHPFKTNGAAQLRAPDGTATNHINGLIALIFNLKKHNIYQVWVFDNNKGADSLKHIELERRKTCKLNAANKLNEINAIIEHKELFSDDDTDNDNIEYDIKNNKDIAVQKNKYERASFSLEEYMINDLKFILHQFNIPWLESPYGYEAEQIAAYLTTNSIHGIKADYVLTPDPDCLLFNATCMIKNDKQKFYKYDLNDILMQHKINLDEFIKIGVILGCDFAPKTPKIGPKTVLKKFNIIELQPRQQDAFDYFKKNICPNAIQQVKWNIEDYKNSFLNTKNNKSLYEWLITIKGFNKIRMESRFSSAKINI